MGMELLQGETIFLFKFRLCDSKGSSDSLINLVLALNRASAFVHNNQNKNHGNRNLQDHSKEANGNREVEG
jgi:hypothetical protein